MDTPALVGLGSNVGDRKARLDRAVAELSGTPGLAVLAVSSYRETAPIGGPGGQGPFLNAAARIESGIDPFALLHVLRTIEESAGRVRTVRWGERTLDLDLLIFGREVIREPGLTVPHPRMAVRRFVLAPLVEIAPTVVDPATGRSVASLLANLDRRPSYVAIDASASTFRDDLFARVVAGLPSVGLAEAEIAPTGDLDDASPRAATLATKWRHLDGRRWADALGDGRWLVTDFYALPSSVDFDDPRSGPALSPTFVVATSGGSSDSLHPIDPGRPRRANTRPTGDVLVHPESTTAEGIAREVIAACEATRTG